jgi:hypothetical protein
MSRTRLTLTQLEERETPSSVTGPVDPSGGSTTPSQPAQTQPPTNGPTDPHGSP